MRQLLDHQRGGFSVVVRAVPVADAWTIDRCDERLSKFPAGIQFAGEGVGPRLLVPVKVSVKFPRANAQVEA